MRYYFIKQGFTIRAMRKRKRGIIKNNKVLIDVCVDL